jgi:Family of unknown function (DUF5681)
MSSRGRGGDYETGYRNPPVAGRFRKGQSGNPRGRPRGRSRELPYEAVLGQMVAVREDGRERRITSAEAFLLQAAKKGLEGDGAAGRATIGAIEKARAQQLFRAENTVTTIELVAVAPGSVNIALEPLRMARKLDRYRGSARMALEPWIVEAALVRLDNKRLTVEEQRTVVSATRTPQKVNWPQWWEVRE